MGLVSGVVTYLCIWWTVLFCTLPIGVNPHTEENLGTAGSAPDKPKLFFKFMLTTIISAVIWIVIFTLIQMEIIDFFEIANQMHEDSRKDIAE